MATDVSNRNVDVLKHLLEDPTRSIKELAKCMNSYRQKVWRKKKKLEDDHVIWGYTAVVDETKFDHQMYVLLFKGKPIDKDFADLFTRRIVKNEFCKQDVRLINVLYVNGEYDFIVMFSAQDNARARRYYDCLRDVYADYLLEKPVMIDVCFTAIREGKTNPEIKKMYEFVSMD